MTRISLFAAVAALVLVSAPALASHGKAGLWRATTTMTMTMAGGRAMPTQTHSGTFCMTPQQVASDAPPASQPNQNCKMTNIHHDGHTVTADMVCHGQMEGTEHMSVTYDGDTHYHGTFAMAMNGMTMNSAIEGTWLKADCAGAAH